MWVGSSICPAGGDVLVGAGGDGGEVVAVGNVGVHGVAVVDGLGGLGLVLGDAVEVDDAVAEVDVVAGDADGALDQEEVGRFGLGLRKTMMSPRLDVAIVDEGRPAGGGAREMRSTRTWSPMSSVLTMEADGISKFWKMNVMTKRPTASTLQMEASDSRGVSV